MDSCGGMADATYGRSDDSARRGSRRTRLTLLFRLSGYGWLDASLGACGTTVPMRVSDLSDALGDLTRRTLALLQGADEARCSWEDEPGEYRWVLTRRGDLLDLALLRFGDIAAETPDEEGTRLFNGQCELPWFAAQLQGQLQQLLDELGQAGYGQRWGHGFPMREFEQLTQRVAPIRAQIEMQEALLNSARAGDTDRVAALLEEGSEVDGCDPCFWTPLMWAVAEGHPDTATLLLRHGASVNVADGYGMTPLIVAAWKGYTDLIQLLIEAGADLNETGWHSMTALAYAAKGGYVDIAVRLIDRGADLDRGNWPPVMQAAGGGDIRMLRLLLDRGADVNAQAESGGTALITAAGEGFTEIVSVLLKRGADPHVADRQGHTALTYAEEGGHLEVVELLRQAIEKQ
jgi:ankyrin repeat protein